MGRVVRVGETKAVDLVKGYKGSSWGARSLWLLGAVPSHAVLARPARAGQYPNAQLSIAQDTDLLAALRPIGCSMRLVSSPGAGYHHTFGAV